MTDPVKEQLSACLDGELPEEQLDLLLRQVQRDTPLRETMGRYSLVGEALRGQIPVRASAGFADRVAAAVAAEHIPASTLRRSTAIRWLQPLAGLAVAAGVAAVAILSFRPAVDDGQPLAVNGPTAVESAAGQAPSYTVPTNVDSTAGALVPAARLTNYVVAHSEFSSPLGRRTVLSGVLSDDDAGGAGTEDADIQVTGAPGESTPADGSTH